MVSTENRYWGQTSVLILEHKRGKVAIMDDVASGGLKVLTRAHEDWQTLNDFITDEEETLA